MTGIQKILASLEATPELLRAMLKEAPAERLKTRRIAGKWSIHEHACHMSLVDRAIIIPRWRMFLAEARPEIVPFSGEPEEPDALLKLDLAMALDNFEERRIELVALVKKSRKIDWNKEASHPEYERYTPLIMLRHVMLHDHLHMYRIEEQMLTRDEYLSKC